MINGRTNKMVSTFSPGFSIGGPVVDSRTNTVYVTNGAARQLVVLNWVRR